MKVNKDRIKEFMSLFLYHGLIIGLCIAMFYSFEENRLLREDGLSKDLYIKKLVERDSIMRHKYMGADSLGTFVYRYVGDSVISYRTLLDITDRLEDELKLQKIKNREFNDSLWVKSSVINMLKEDIDFRYKVVKENGKLSVILSVSK